MVTASIVDIAERVLTIITDSYVNLGISTLLDGAATPCTFYGDQEIVPSGVTVCVEPAVKTRRWDGAPAQTLNDFGIRVIAYVDKVADDQSTRRQCDRLAEALEHLLHADLQLHDVSGQQLIIQGLVSRIDFGYVNRGTGMGSSRLLRAATLVYSPLTKTSVTLP